MKICGMDECGRGAFAGPLVGAAVVINCPVAHVHSAFDFDLKDSKKLTEKQRVAVVNTVTKLPVKFYLQEISVDQINSCGIGWANIEVFKLLGEKIKADQYLIDGNLKFENPQYLSIVRGDTSVAQIMLASIIAKVHRDNLLKGLHLEHPAYGWDSNSGYGTKYHIDSIIQNGLSIHHRKEYVNTCFRRRGLSLTVA